MTKSCLKRDLGQLLICGFYGTEPTEGILDLIRNHNLGSIIYFSRNIESPEQVQRLTHALQTAAKDANHTRPLLIAVDQENGVVRRLGTSGTYLPGSMALGAIGSTNDAYQVAAATSKELLALGINWNLAPVMDINNNSLNPVIGVRSFGEDPECVSQLGTAQVEAYQKNRVVTSIKHFPGHGDTATDSHLGVPVIDKSLDDLEAVELVPFRKAIAAKGEAYPSTIMLGHISLPRIIKEKDRPGSIASEIANDLLRNKIGYNGLIITDCLEMDAVKDTVGTPAGAVMAIKAGNDMAMISHTLQFQQDAFKMLEGALDDGTLDEEAVMASLARIGALKDKYLSWDDALQLQSLSVIGCKEHLDLSERLYNKVPTLVRNRMQTVPFHPKEGQKILFLAADVPLTLAIDSETEPFNSMYDSICHRHSNTEYFIFKEEDVHNLTKKIDESDYVIIGTANGNLHPFQADLVKLASACANSKLIVVAVINPYDLMAFPNVDTYLVAYEYTPPAHEAIVRMIFGEIKSHSRLPVTIPKIDDAKIGDRYDAFKVEKFDLGNFKEVSLAYDLWKIVYNDTWPLSLEKFSLVLSRFQQPCHFVVHDTQGDIIGFAATQTISEENQGQLALLVVHPDYRKRGIGSQLNDSCLELFRRNDSSVMLGSSYPRFFCGVPDSDKIGQEAQAFFKRRGYTLKDDVVWDLIGDISKYEIPDALTARMEKEKVWFGTIEPERIEELFSFQAKYFDYWLSTYRHHAKLGDYQDLVVAREGGKDGKILGSLVLHTTKGSHEYRSDLIWTDASLLGTKSGGMACVGVAEEERGRGIGVSIVAYANKLLRERGVEKSLVDWVELVDFYSRTGYQTWRSYRLGAMK